MVILIWVFQSFSQVRRVSLCHLQENNSQNLLVIKFELSIETPNFGKLRSATVSLTSFPILRPF